MALDKQKKEMIVIGIGIAVLLFVIPTAFKTKKKVPAKKGPAKPAESAKPSAGSQPANVSASAGAGSAQIKVGGFVPPDPAIIKAQLDRIAGQDSGKDPFYAKAEKITSKRGSLVLKGISWKENGASFALINQDIVRAGDTISDSKVVRINKDRVTLEKDGQEYILILEELK